MNYQFITSTFKLILLIDGQELFIYLYVSILKVIFEFNIKYNYQ